MVGDVVTAIDVNNDLDFGFWIGKDSPATEVAASDTKSAYADSDLKCLNRCGDCYISRDGMVLARLTADPADDRFTIHYRLFNPKSKIQNHIMRIAALGLDVGGKRIGVAGCDGLGMMATGITTIWRSSFDRDIAQLAEIIADRQVEILVLGLPYTMDGAIGSQAKQVQKFGRRVAAGLGLPIEYVDERLTSYAAEQMMIASNISVSQNKGTIDRIAAAVILQQWLDERRVGK